MSAFVERDLSRKGESGYGKIFKRRELFFT